MEFNIHLDQSGIDTTGIERQLHGIDPAGIVDLDPSGRLLRISTVLSDLELAAFMRASGHPLGTSQIERLPSTCCGGCGG